MQKAVVNGIFLSKIDIETELKGITRRAFLDNIARMKLSEMLEGRNGHEIDYAGIGIPVLRED